MFFAILSAISPYLNISLGEIEPPFMYSEQTTTPMRHLTTNLYCAVSNGSEKHSVTASHIGSASPMI